LTTSRPSPGDYTGEGRLVVNNKTVDIRGVALQGDSPVDDPADWAVSADLQAGLWINAAGSARGLRVAIDVYRGRSPQRILGLQRERYGGIALYFEL